MFLTEIGHDRHESGAHKKRRVAVIVFGEVLSYDESDAESGLMLAVRQALPRELEGMGASRVIPCVGSGGSRFRNGSRRRSLCRCGSRTRRGVTIMSIFGDRLSPAIMLLIEGQNQGRKKPRPKPGP